MIFACIKELDAVELLMFVAEISADEKIGLRIAFRRQHLYGWKVLMNPFCQIAA